MRKLIILLVLSLCACSNQFSEPTCTMVDFSERTEKVWNNFNELESLAVESPHNDKIKLPSIMNQLQETRDVYAQLKLPSCYEAAHSSYLEYMDLTIETWSYVVEGGEAFDSEFWDLMNVSTIALGRAIDESNKLGK
jgi:hypothetical protein